VPIDTELAKLLEVSVEQVAEGPEEVTAGVTELLGIGYEHFTQCVLLPQGRFAEFLHAKPGDRQDLLIELLAYAVYEQVGQRARERGKEAATKLALAEKQLTDLGEVTEAELTAADQRVTDLAALVEPVDEAVISMRDLRDRWTRANEDAKRAREQLDALGDLRTPQGVPKLAARLADADDLIRARTKALTTAEAAEADAEQACVGLPEPAVLRGWQESHARAEALRTELTKLRDTSTRAETDEKSLADAMLAAEQALAAAEADVQRIDREHRAAALAVDLRVGESCPVCHQSVGALPHHDTSADVGAARSTAETARKALAANGKSHTAAGRVAAAASAAVTSAEQQLTLLTQQLDGAPQPTELAATIQHREAADRTLTTARAAARQARATAKTATDERGALVETEQRAWSELRASRDRFVAANAPAVEGTDLAAAWQTLVDWAATQRDLLTGQAAELERAEADLREQGTAAATALTELLAQQGIELTTADKAPIDLATHRERADRAVADLRKRRQDTEKLTGEVAKHRQDHEVADMLGTLLRSDRFERWLCTEALDSLVLEASQTLLQLSNGQYELHRGDRNDLAVIDHNDAGTQRPVNTLSGGETFQASLALALALSSQVVALSGGRRDLNSMFLDEGFGTLDEATLDTVATTLEQLAAGTNRMVGIVTHVPALAERVPVQFAVRRDGASSRVQRVGV
jgi:DNA repair protein SbcC/Rad50